jgi:hypothetical protein
MREYLLKISVLAVLISASYSCTTQEEDLELNINYLTVSDALEYCQGGCVDLLEWEGSGIWVKGHIPDLENEEAMNDAYGKGRVFLHDIRNGLFLEVQVTGDKDVIFNFLNGATKQDEINIRGTAGSVIVNEGDECMKGLVVLLTSAQDIEINL